MSVVLMGIVKIMDEDEMGIDFPQDTLNLPDQVLLDREFRVRIATPLNLLRAKPFCRSLLLSLAYPFRRAALTLRHDHQENAVAIANIFH